MGWPPGRAGLVGLGVDEGKGDPNAFRSRVGLGDDPYLMYLGRVEDGKGTTDLARMFAAFKGRHPGPLKLVIAGPVVRPPPPHDDVVVPVLHVRGIRPAPRLRASDWFQHAW